MKRKLIFLFFLLLNTSAGFSQTKNSRIIPVFKDVSFYDGYAKPVNEPVPENLVRVSNTIYVRKLSSVEKQWVGDSLAIRIIVRFACDDYDRIGRAAFITVAKGKNYDDISATQYEILRIMTPFNYKTRQPDNIPYMAQINQLAGLLKDPSTDVWIMTEIFGTTSAGQKETMGCDGSLLTYTASVDLITNNTRHTKNLNTIPLLSYFSLDGKDSSAGHNAKETSFHLKKNSTDVMLYLITSGHGAGQGGEEYNWREHVVYVDGKEIMRLPVNQDCVPYEIYNTRNNGIYGYGESIAGQRRSWCPGAPVPTRVIKLGALAASNHTIKIAVPDANLMRTNSTYYISAYVVAQ